MNNVGKPALYGLTQLTIGTFFSGNHLNTILKKVITCVFKVLKFLVCRVRDSQRNAQSILINEKLKL
jgi:hypothetical protein